MKKTLMAFGLFACVFLMSGCDEDQRNTEEKLEAPPPEYTTRWVMACPKCGAPQAPYRIDQIKSYYKCSGQQPKFKYHKEKEWSHRLHKTDKVYPEHEER